VTSAGPQTLEDGDPLIGRIIAGKYKVLSCVGTGGMGAVYKAQHFTLNKAVAVKVLHRSLEEDQQFVSRFKVEAKAASMMDHPNSTRVMDFGEEPDGLLYIVMEYLEGKNLLDVILADSPLETARIADIVRQTLAALAVAHEMGILHRDLKPENIMILRGRDDEGMAHDVVKVCDFGIAKLSDVAGFATATLADGPAARAANGLSGLGIDTKAVSFAPSITRTGLIIGTPEYMSPEQARGEPADVRSDIYSVGCVLYHLITGKPPFVGDTPLVTALLHATVEARPIAELRPSVDPTLERVCRRAMSKEANERYASAREMRADLREAASISGSTAPLQLSSGHTSGSMPGANYLGPATGTTRGGTSSEDRLSAGSEPRLEPIAASAMEPEPIAGRPRRSGFLLAFALLLVGVGSGGWMFFKRVRAVDATTTPSTVSSVVAPSASVASPASPLASAAPSASAAPLASTAMSATPATTGADPETPTSPTAVPSTSAAAPPAHGGPHHETDGTTSTSTATAAAPSGRGHPRVNIVAIHPEHVTYEAVYKVVNGGAITRCYVSALKKHPEAQGGSPTLTLDFEADKVTSAKLDEDLGMPELGPCVAHHLTGMNVPGATDPGHATAELLFSTE
jgi:serine/threonine protein kinase